MGLLLAKDWQQCTILCRSDEYEWPFLNCNSSTADVDLLHPWPHGSRASLILTTWSSLPSVWSIEPSDSQTGNIKYKSHRSGPSSLIFFTTHYPSFPPRKKNMLSKLPIIITAFVVAVNAQSPSSSGVPAIPSLTPCVTECITKAAALDDCVSLYVSWHIHSHLAIILIIF